MELNRDQIVKALECCIRGDDCTLCPLFDEQSCPCVLNENALAIIKELTEENEAWQKQLITTKEQSEKAYYELACEVEDLRAENERLRGDRAKIFEYKHGTLVRNALVLTKNKNEFDDFCKAIKADNVREVQERLKECFDNEIEHKSIYTESQVLFVIDQIAKEKLEET